MSAHPARRRLCALHAPAWTRNAASRRICKDPRDGRRMLGLMATRAFGALVPGLAGASPAGHTRVHQRGAGLFALRQIGLLTTAIERRAHHRRDRVTRVLQPETAA